MFDLIDADMSGEKTFSTISRIKSSTRFCSWSYSISVLTEEKLLKNEWMMRHQCVGLTPTKKLHDVRRRIHHGIAKWLPQLASSIAWIALFSSFRTFSANIVIFCQWSFLDSIFYTTLTSSRESTASCTAAL